MVRLSTVVAWHADRGQGKTGSETEPRSYNSSLSLCVGAFCVFICFSFPFCFSLLYRWFCTFPLLLLCFCSYSTVVSSILSLDSRFSFRFSVQSSWGRSCYAVRPSLPSSVRPSASSFRVSICCVEVMSCHNYVVLSFVMMIFIMSCHVMPCYVTFCCVFLYYVLLCRAMLCHVMFHMIHHVMLCSVTLCCGMPCYAMLCHAL